MRLKHILAMAPLALGAAYGCIDTDDVVGEETYALNINDLTLNPGSMTVNPQARILNFNVIDRSKIVSGPFYNIGHK